MMKKIMLMFFVFLSACTAVDVKPVSNEYNITHVCIQENPKVIVQGFVSTLEEVFEDHLMTTEVYSDQKPEHCEFTLKYTALRSWDFAPYLSHAELRLYRGNQRIGYAEYHLNGKGGLSLMKWSSVKTKMTPVINELLAQFR